MHQLILFDVAFRRLDLQQGVNQLIHRHPVARRQLPVLLHKKLFSFGITDCGILTSFSPGRSGCEDLIVLHQSTSVPISVCAMQAGIVRILKELYRLSEAVITHSSHVFVPKEHLTEKEREEQ